MKLPHWSLPRTAFLGFWLLLGALGSLGGCGGGGAGDSDQSQDQGCQLRGRVSFGGPVSGALVVLSIKEQTGFRELCSTESGVDGSFLLTLPPGECWGQARVEALGTEAAWTEEADQAPCGFSLGASLRLDLPDLAQLGQRPIFLHPWTELAAALADAYGRRPGNEDWKATISLAQGLLAMHLDRQNPPDLPFTDAFAPSAGPWPWPNPATRLGLLTAGLSVEARSMGTWDGPENCGAELLALLTLDASDGLFDGRALDCPKTEADCALTKALEANPGLPPLDSQLLRGTLARATHLYASGERNLSGVSPQDLGVDDGLYESLSGATGPLFPMNEPGLNFDPLPPHLEILASSAPEGACLGEPFSIVVEASDDHGLELFDWQSACGAVETRKGGRLTLEVTPGEAGCQGPVDFLFRAQDPAGNRVTATRRLIPDTLVPALEAPDWSPRCPLDWPQPLVLREAQDACPLVKVGAGPGWCSKTAEGLWTCPTPPVEELLLELTLKDEAGNRKPLALQICPDHAAPVVNLLEPTCKWFGPLVLAAELELTDEWGVAKVDLSLNGTPVDPQELLGLGTEEVRVSLPLPNDQGPLLLEVRAEDSNGNFVLRDFELVPDLEPPEILVPAEVEPHGAELALLPFVATDAVSGLAELRVESPEGWIVEDLGDGGARVAKGPPPPGLSFEVKLRATDAAGNQTRTSAWMARDQTAPQLRLLPTQSLQENTLKVTKEGEAFVYTPTGDPVELSEETCAVECPYLVKRTPNLLASGVEDAKPRNLPLFRVWAGDSVDGGEAVGLGRVVRLEARLMNGDRELAKVEAAPNEAEGLVELAVYWPLLFDEGGEEPTVTAENLPQELVVEARDSCGNSSSRSYALNLNIYGPPLDLTVELTGPGNFTTVRELFDTGTPWDLKGELAGGVLRVKNPTPFSSFIAFHSYYGRSRCQVISAGGYLALHKDPRGQGCASGLCRVVAGTDWTTTTLGKCQTPAEYSEETLHDAWTSVEPLLFDPTDAAVTAFDAEPVPLAPFQELLVVLKVDSTCLPKVVGVQTLYIPGEPAAQTIQTPILTGERGLAICLPATGGPKSYVYDISPKLTTLAIQSQQPMDQLTVMALPPGQGDLELRPVQVRWDGQFTSPPGPALPPL